MWPERYHEMSLGNALVALWKTPRVYYKGNQLIDPRQGHVYETLGHGLDISNITFRKLDKEESLVRIIKKPKAKIGKVIKEK
jgi:hypothetical protein